MPQASGVFKQLARKRETTYGTAAGASGAKLLRRVTSDVSLTKQTYQSNEIRPDQQVADFRHGVRSVEGTLSGELSPGTYADEISAVLRRDFTAGATASSLSLTIAGSGPTYTITRAAGDWLADGFKRGKVVRLSGGGLNVANTAKNLLIQSMTATVLTVRVLNGSALAAEGPIASSTCTVVGKDTFAPTTGHTNVSYSLEHWFADVTQNELFTGVQPTKVDIGLPPTGMATISIPVVGQNVTTATSRYFTSPSAASTTGICAAVNGVVLLGGVAVALLTGLSISIDSPRSGDPVVGSNTIPTRFPGRITASGQATAYFEDATLRDAFINETEVELIVVLTSDNSAASDFVGITLPRVKLGGASKSDGEQGIVQTLPFTALLPLTGGSGVANELSTVVVQDSAAP
ncbi:phage tail tube protein [Pseudaquabacterium pictum]|uniref:Uncharacterized protein n=1 Tax=Pseudaquabacterium pictum TaxID=2315236 RepID=A0A480AIP8_9BURK|nr:phage tail tube protein [Rubrivivax pictus]GCL61491.1 hypothetical protein AQPW35_05720 [Rubrivivax pictus]